MRVTMLVMGAAALFLAAAGCGSNATQGGQQKPASGKLNVACTVGMVASLAQTIGRENVEVHTLMGAGTDPHLYKAREADIRTLDSAAIIFYNGLNLEGKMADLFEKLATKRPHVYAVSKPIDPAQLRKPTEFEGHYDPHIWFDVSLWKKAADAVRDGLIAADAAHADSYRANAAALAKEMNELHAWCKTQIASIPKDRRVLVTAHDAFGYFGRAYDMEVYGIQGISTEDQAPLQAINSLVNTISSRKIKAIFVESSVPRKNINALIEGCQSKGHAVAIGGELYSDAMGAEGTPDGTYIGMVRHNVETIVKALK